MENTFVEIREQVEGLGNVDEERCLVEGWLLVDIVC